MAKYEIVYQAHDRSPLLVGDNKVQFAHRISLELRQDNTHIRSVPVMISETDLLKLPARSDEEADAHFWSAFALMGAAQIEDHVWHGDDPALWEAIFPPAQQAFERAKDSRGLPVLEVGRRIYEFEADPI